MHAALFTLSQLIATTTPTPTPTEVVLHGCGLSSAIRVAELRLTPAGDARAATLLDTILAERDGAACLVESNVLVELHQAGTAPDLVRRALDRGLVSPDQAIAERAGTLLGRIRDLDPSAYDELVRGGLWIAADTGPSPRAPGVGPATAAKL